jgi:phosphoribosylaminoimidazolecarboxamide formyltransferase/IMP cyclohydrolase
LNGLRKIRKKKSIDNRSVGGGSFRQEHDIWFNDPKKWKVVSEKKPTRKDLETMEFAVKCIKHVKSNSVLFAKDKRTIAIGGGQTSRIEATRIAIRKGGEKIKGSTMVSDAFFPFPDCVELAVQARVRAFVHPGGSKRDQESIDMANMYRAAMVFTGQRYFRH